MSEFDHFTINGMTAGGWVSLECVPENTELYLHGDDYEEVNHLFHRMSRIERALGAFIWRSTIGDEEFDRISEAMVDSENWTIVYHPKPTEGDLDQWAIDHNSIPDELPEGFS